MTVVRRDDCAHGRAAIAAMAGLASRFGTSVWIEDVVVRTDDDARAAGCIGSYPGSQPGHPGVPGETMWRAAFREAGWIESARLKERRFGPILGGRVRGVGGGAIVRDWRTRFIGLGAVGLLLGCACVALAEAPQRDAAPASVVRDYDVPPKVLEITRPEYPRQAVEAGVEGTVVIELVIDGRGKVVRTKVLESVPQLDEAAIRCARKWRFKPAEKDGRPVATVAHAPVLFRREGKKDAKL